jgi:tryptophan 2,3-dioxygenase
LPDIIATMVENIVTIKVGTIISEGAEDPESALNLIMFKGIS